MNALAITSITNFVLASEVFFLAGLSAQKPKARFSAAWFWSVNKCGPLADADDFVGLTRRINGGTIGLEDRQRRYKAILK